MSFFVCGMNHRTAPVEIRERVAAAHQNLEGALQRILAEKGIYEAVILSTCNRCELYAIADDARRLKNWLGKNHCPQDSQVDQYLYSYEGAEAFAHSVRVASGMDSMVLGEPQIFGQMKDALSVAGDLGVAGPKLSRLFQHIFSVTKKVRSQTFIGENSLSVAYIATLLAKKLYGDLKGLRVLLVGAGDTIQTVARHFHEQGVTQLVAANRSIDNAAWMKSLNGQVISLEELEVAMGQCDIIVSAVDGTRIIQREVMERVLKTPREQPLYCVDLGMPRNLDPQIAEMDGVHLYNIDDLHHVVKEGLSKRKAALEEAEIIISTLTQQSLRKLNNDDFTTVIKDYRGKINELREIELSKALSKLHKGQPPEEVITDLAYSLANKLMHHPSEQLNKASSEGQYHVLSIARELLGIGET